MRPFFVLLDAARHLVVYDASRVVLIDESGDATPIFLPTHEIRTTDQYVDLRTSIETQVRALRNANAAKGPA